MKKMIVAIAATMIAATAPASFDGSIDWSKDSFNKSTNSVKESSKSTYRGAQKVANITVKTTSNAWDSIKDSYGNAWDNTEKSSENAWTSSEGFFYEDLGCANIDRVCGNIWINSTGFSANVFDSVSGAFTFSGAFEFSGQSSAEVVTAMANAIEFTINAAGDITFTTFASSGNMVQYIIKGEFKKAGQELIYYPKNVYKAAVGSEMHYKSL